MLNTHSPLSGYYPSNKVPSRSTFTLFGKENWRLSFLCEGSKLMICVMYVFSDMSEYEGTMLENNKEAVLGTMWRNQITFVYKQPPT